LSRIKTLNGRRVHGISPVRKENIYGGNDLPKSHVLKVQNERLNEYEKMQVVIVKMVKKMNCHV